MKGSVLLSILSTSYAVKVARTSHHEMLATYSTAVMDPDMDDPDAGGVMKRISGHVDLASALNAVQHKELPAPVAHMVQSAATSNSTAFASYDDASMEKARVALNSLIEKAWVELDDKILKCKGFQDMNRENYGQTTRDLSRLVEQISDMERLESESIDGGASAVAELERVEEVLAKETGAYQSEFDANDAELKIRKNDLEVFQFVLEFTKCDDNSETAFLQTAYQVCQTNSGRRTLLFKDQKVAHKFKAMLQPSSRRSLDNLLSIVHGHSPASFLQIGAAGSAPVVGEDGLPCATSGMGDEDECMKSCSPDATPDCGLLHDKLSLMWGEFKDSVDELTMEMAKNEDKWRELKQSLNAQIELLGNKNSRFKQLLKEARSNLASDRQEKKEKEKEKKTLDEEYQAYMKQCKRRIEWIMYQDMCAIRVVRDAVMETSSICPTSKITDCDVGAWVPGECSVSCDDSCNPRKPFECGGWQEMKRDVVVAQDQCGIKCPTLLKYKRCGQYLCPEDCVMSSWSGWSACSADCEGGVQGRTRSMLNKPKNGGEMCGNPEDSRPCNTQSCDRDCSLARWTKWSPCTVACGGGEQNMRRHVLVPTRGDGKCPAPNTRSRYRHRQCNTQDCEGDEVCTAYQDLVVAIDGSGSVQEAGFAILKKFAAQLISRYQTKYFGRKRVKLGLCQFGNGEIQADGKTISPAINVQGLTFSKKAVTDAVKGLSFKKGFTNMAQAFATAETMFTQGSRRDAQSAVLVITDGKPSFSFMTNEMVEQLDDKGIMRHFVVISDQGGNSDVMTQIKAWASQPWSTNVVHVPGLPQLDGDIDMWAQKSLTKFCPQAYSPGKREKFEHANQMQKVFRGGWCKSVRRWYWAGYVNKNRAVQQCKAKAKRAGKQVFLIGRWHRWAWCFYGDMDVSPTLYSQWFHDKANPQCDAGWRNVWYYDFYAIYPQDKQVCSSMGIRVSSQDDCTGQDIWHWQGGHMGFNINEWSTESYDNWGGQGTCVTYARTGGQTCKQYCASFGRTCVRGQDDAHHQVAELNKYLQGEGQAGTMCTAFDEGHERQTTEENGCLQKWGTQVCACK